MEPAINLKTNPLIREALEMGYTTIIEMNGVTNREDKIEFLKNGKVIKSCSPGDIYDLNLTIKGGADYKWIADSDGSSERYRKFLTVEEE